MNPTRIKTHAPSASRHTLLAAGAAFALAALFAACDSGNNSSGNDLRAQLIKEGEQKFSTCAGCHGFDALGTHDAPPLLHSSYIAEDPERVTRILLLGLPNDIDTARTIVVNGVSYTAPEGDQAMPSIASVLGKSWSDRELAAVLTYVRAVLNDSVAVNCTTDSTGEEPVTTCQKQARPEAATDFVAPERVAAVRDSLDALGLLEDE
jgi:mono/diheme cytochrome c family protein